MSKEKHFFDAAMNKDKSNTDKVIELMDSYDPESIVVFYDVDYRPALHWRILRVVAIASIVAGIASWLARKQG